MTDRKKQKLRRKLQESRYRLLTRAPEFAAPLVDMIFVADVEVRRVSTNGSCIYFDTNWLDKLGDWSLDFTLCHQLMHTRKGHLSRPQCYNGDRFHFACNIVANARLVPYGFTEIKLPGIGEIHRETFFPKTDGSYLTPYEAFPMTPFDPATMPVAKIRSIMPDSDEWWDLPEDRGESGTVILSPSDPDPDDLVPGEDIMVIIREELKTFRKQKMPEVKQYEESDDESEDLSDYTFDYITRPKGSLKETIRDLRGLKELDMKSNSYGDLSEHVLRRTNAMPKDWRALLNHFIIEETKDYSFTPPDRRLQDLDFFLPDYNDAEIQRLNVLFMVDVSGSLKEEEVNMAATEICDAIDQFNGMLRGTIAFFDTEVQRQMPISSSVNLLKQSIFYGGGTDFQCIFDYIRDEMADDLPSEIVIMTDGKGDFPDYEATMGIPVLWLLTSNRVRIPWGQATFFRP